MFCITYNLYRHYPSFWVIGEQAVCISEHHTFIFIVLTTLLLVWNLDLYCCVFVVLTEDMSDKCLLVIHLTVI